MKKNIKFYVEFESTESQNIYSLQSRYFDTDSEAIAWYRNNFDYVDMNEIIVSLMKAVFDDNEELQEIIYVCDITAKYLLRNTEIKSNTLLELQRKEEK